MITPRIPRMVRRAVRLVDPRRDQRHLDLVAQLNCCACWRAPPNDYHHLLRVAGEGVKGMALKHKDRFTVPLCADCHTLRGKNCAHGYDGPGGDEAWLAFMGIDGRALADALYATSGDLDAMARVNFAHHQRARLKKQTWSPA